MWPFTNENIPDFKRSDWPHWRDLDRDGDDARQEVLERDSLTDVTRNDRGRIIEGLWSCPYTGRIERDASKMDIDHVISLGEAHRMGGFQWDREQRTAFANDQDNLLAVYRSANRAKSDHDSFDGMPPNIAFWGRYMIFRKATVEKYGLIRTKAELNAIKFYRNRWASHRYWVKMSKVRRFMSDWIPGMF